MATSAELFSAIAHGQPLPEGPWRSAIDARGRSLAHAAAAHGRLDSLWLLLITFPALAALPDFDSVLPEQVATHEYAQRLCSKVRMHFFLEHSAL